MNKYQEKMNSKEALKSLENLLKDLPYAINYKKQHDIISQNIERLEKLEKEYNTMKYCYEKLTNDYDSLKKDFNELLETNNIFYNTKEKYKKAIKILKDKLELELEYNKIENKEYCYLHDYFSPSKLTKQEYELLKEVL